MTCKKVALRLREVLEQPYIHQAIVGTDIPYAHVHLVPFTTTADLHKPERTDTEPNHEAFRTRREARIFMIRILAIGKKHEAWIAAGLARYEKRLKKPFDVEWVLLPHSAREGLSARQEESERILSRTSPDDWVMLLDETGA